MLKTIILPVPHLKFRIKGFLTLYKYYMYWCSFTNILSSWFFKLFSLDPVITHFLRIVIIHFMCVYRKNNEVIFYVFLNIMFSLTEKYILYTKKWKVIFFFNFEEW